MELSVKRKILKNRIKLLRTLLQFVNDESSDGYQCKMVSELIKCIRNDKIRMVAAAPDIELDAVTYAECREDSWLEGRRLHTTLGRLIRRTYGFASDSINDKTLEELSYLLSAESVDVSNLPIQIVNGDKVQEAYGEDARWHSCMTGGEAFRAEIYVNNPDKVSMVIYNNEARALLWTTDEGIQVLDRIYPNSGKHVRIMQNWARANNMLYRISASLDPSTLSDSTKELHVTLEIGNYLPYFDTWRQSTYIGRKHSRDTRKAVFSNGQNFGKSDRKWPAVSTCSLCASQHIKGKLLWEDWDKVWAESGSGPYCKDCAEYKFTLCARCYDMLEINRDTSIYYVADMSEYWCFVCAADHAFNCNNCNRLFSLDYGHVLIDKDRVYCEHCVETTGTFHICSQCGDIVIDRVQLKSGEDVCLTCHDKLARANLVLSCWECGGYDRKEKGKEEEPHGYWYCDRCHQKREDSKARKAGNKTDTQTATASRPASPLFTLPPE